MDTISSTIWQRRGSCIVFDRESLGTFIAGGALVSLQEALGWMKGLPSMPPVPGHSILISGLETMIEILSPADAEEFLIHRIRPLLITLQSSWPAFGVVFGFSSHEKAFEETSLEESVLFRRRDRKTVRLSDGLWDGTATVNMKLVIRQGDKPGEEILVGYHVARIS